MINVSGDQGFGFYKGNDIYDSDLYTLHGYYKPDGSCEYRLFDKTLGILYRNSQLDSFECVNGFYYLYIKESSIYFRNQNGTLKSFEINYNLFFFPRLILFRKSSLFQLLVFFLSK